jgi:Zn-dependent protease
VTTPPAFPPSPPPQADPRSPADGQRRPSLSGGIRLFRLFGITVFLHWSWLFVAYFDINTRRREYSSLGWNVLEYLSLFAIVLMHEFGHSLACKSVGGQADRIMLWPLGGVAFVRPPERPGAVLWSIVAGPLVNVALLPVTFGLAALLRSRPGVSPDLVKYADTIFLINLVILVFNLLPIYPLDGGQILRSLLWFVIGRARSLTVAAAIGVAGALGVLVFAVKSENVWYIVLALFGLLTSWNGLKQGRALGALASAPRRAAGTREDESAPASGPRCPNCGAPPPVGAWWRCACGQTLDPFESPACPRCGRDVQQAACPECGTAQPLVAWYPDPGAMPRPSLVPLLRMPPPPDPPMLERDRSTP